MITETEIQSILTHTIIDLRERGIIRDTPSLSHNLYPAQQVYNTHNTLDRHQTNQLLHHSLTQGNTSQISYNSSWGNIHSQQYSVSPSSDIINPINQTNNEVAFLSDSSLDSLQLEDSLEREITQSGKEIVIQEFQSQHSVAKEEDTDKFDCFPTGFEIHSSQDNSNNNNNNNNNKTETINMNPNQSDQGISIRCDINMVKNDSVITDENNQIQDEIGYEDVATDSTSRRRGIKR